MTGERSSDLLMSSVIFDRHEKQESRGNAAQDHLLHAAETEEAQAHRGGEHDHGGKKKRSRQQLLILQAVAGGDKTSPIGQLDIGRELPKRHGLRCGEAFAHLLERQVGGEPVGLLERRRPAAYVDPRVLEPPIALLKVAVFASIRSWKWPALSKV